MTAIMQDAPLCHSRESGNPETRTILRHFAQHFMGKGLTSPACTTHDAPSITVSADPARIIRNERPGHRTTGLPVMPLLGSGFAAGEIHRIGTVADRPGPESEYARKNILEPSRFSPFRDLLPTRRSRHQAPADGRILVVWSKRSRTRGRSRKNGSTTTTQPCGDPEGRGQPMPTLSNLPATRAWPSSTMTMLRSRHPAAAGARGRAAFASARPPGRAYPPSRTYRANAMEGGRERRRTDP